MSHTPPSTYPHSTGYSTSMAERNDLHDMSPDELEVECQHLRDENHQLQLRILGVNELARLLQDRSEMVQVLEEKNKRLEIAVVRLENRCANMDRTLKSQKGANVPTAKPGQSPFIPGPSRQILEGLMKENSDLKKTVSGLTGKGAAGYLEAVKATQLEEVIDQQKQEIEFLKEQINQLTSTGVIEDKTETSVGQLTSLPANVSDSGPLRRQLIQLQRQMKVKDRFCTLLSQQVSQLQNRLASIEYQDATELSTTGPPQQESTGHEILQRKEVPGGEESLKKLYDDAQNMLAKERDLRQSQGDKLSTLEKELNERNRTIDKLEQKCDELTSYHQTLLMEKSELNDMLKETHQRMESLSISGTDGGSPQRRSADPSVDHLKKELKDSIDQVNDLRAQLEEANVRTAISDSKLGEIESKHAQQLGEYESMINEKNQEVRNYQEKLHQSEHRITNLVDQVKDLEEDLRYKDDEHSNLLREISEGKHSSSRSSAPGISSRQLTQMSVRSGGAPALFSLESHIGPDDVTTPQQHQKIRNPTVQTLLCRDPEGQQPSQKQQPPTNLGLNTTTQPPGRTSPGPHHAMQPQMMQAKGQPHPQQQLQTPATPIAPNQGSYAAVPSHSVSSYTHTMGMTGPSGIYMPSGSGQPTNQAMFGTGNVPSMGYTGQTRVTGPGGGTIQGRPRTMPITSPSPTPGTGNRTLGGSGSLPPRTSYTSYHQGTGIPISTVAQYSSGAGSYPSANYGSPGLSGTPIYQTGTPGGRVVRGSTPYGPSGTMFGGPGMSGNSHASHMYGSGSAYSSSPQLHQQYQQQQQQPHGVYTRVNSGASSGYGSGGQGLTSDYSGDMSGSMGMRPGTYTQQSSTGGYPGGQGGASGQYGSSSMRPTSPRSYDPSGGYQGGHGGGASGQYRGPH